MISGKSATADDVVVARPAIGPLLYLTVPTAEVFPFDVDLRWPQEIAGKK